MTKTHSDKPTSAKLPIELDARLKKASKSSRIPVSAFITVGLELVMEEYERTGKLPESWEEARAAAIEAARPSKKSERKSG